MPSDRELRIHKREFYLVKQDLETLLNVQPSSIENLHRLETIVESSYKPTFDKFNETATKLYLEIDEENEDDKKLEKLVLKQQTEVRQAFSLLQANIKSYALKLKGEEQRKSLLNSSLLDQSSSSSSNEPKLKRIEIPEFDGDLSNFYNFKALFSNLVHNNPDFNNVQKLYYLKQSLVGNAAIVLRDCDLAEDAYAEAWNYFLQRYESKRAIVRNFFVKLSSLQPIRSEAGIRQLLDETQAIIRGLKVAGEVVNDTFSRYISYIVSSKLDSSTAKDWENTTCSESTYPKFEKLFKFLQGRTFVIDERQTEKPKDSSKSASTKKTVSTASKIGPTCLMCPNKTHFLNQCESFKALSPHRRFDLIKENHLCLVCFSKDHSALKCNSRFKCKCGKPHHYLLHFEFKSPSSSSSSNGSKEDSSRNNDSSGSNGNSKKENEGPNTKSSMSCHRENQDKIILLPTAIVRLECGNVNVTIRVLLDSGSQATLVSDTLIKKFKIPEIESDSLSRFRGISPGIVSTSRFAKLTLCSRETKNSSIDIEAEIVPKSSMAYEVFAEIPKSDVNQLAKFRLADPALLKNPVRIDDVDVIIGSEYYERCIQNSSYEVNGLGLRLSIFGWTVAGSIPENKSSSKKFSGFTLRSIEENLQKFWEIESVEKPKPEMESEMDRCVQHFEATHQIASDGKFGVRLPFKVDKSLVANNRCIALKSLFRLERSLDSKLKIAYVNFIQEYISLGHASLAIEKEEPSYYIPHRAVVREESLTTPVRVVFNASSSSKGEMSLNEALMIGPQIQRELFDILISVRSYCYVFSADIEKMYRMIWVNEEDRNMQRILWRNSPEEPVREYRLNTITYGTAPASFIATQCLEMVAREIENLHPEAAKLIRENFYMDDLIAGGDDIQEVRKNRKIIHDALLSHGFCLRKYCANFEEIVSDISPNLLLNGSREQPVESVAILGICWLLGADSFCIKLNLELIDGSLKITKRLMMSYLARTFDPLGLISPVGLRGKLMLQMLWREGLDWDVAVPDSISKCFVEYIQDLRKLESYTIPRYVSFPGSRSQLVGFCDASPVAYCAMLYVRSLVGDVVVKCSLVCSKTRVAPVKVSTTPMTTPKLELCSALLLAQLVDRIRKTLIVDMQDCFFFTDSTVVLCWLSKPAVEWKTFVANRVEKIHSLVPYNHWFYVNTKKNPADLATRGLSSNEFLASPEWINGPSFLKSPDIRSDPIPNTDVSIALEKRKKKVVSVNQVVVSDSFIDRFSSFNRLLRVLAYIVRFTDRTRKKPVNLNVNLSKAELDNALILAIRIVQSVYFFDDVDRLSRNLALKAKSKLLSLTPFLDEDRILRVGGRLKHADISEKKKHPVILPAKAHLVRIMLRWVHEKFFHANRKFLLGYLASQYWIVGGCSNLVKAVVRNCVQCVRYKAETVSQMMGQLPRARVNVSRPFSHTGVDLAGPFQCKCVAHRSMRHYKIYIAIFVCMVVKCVHIEIVTDLTTAKFIEAMQRFVSRRGAPCKMYSDNGTNFAGLRNLIVFNRAQIESYAASEGIDWSMIPPRSPHFGGLWESAVRSAKYHLARINDGNVLSYDEYSTLFTRIEAILNSRPICTKVDQGDFVLTPAHFLVGESFSSPPVLESIDYAKPFSRRLAELNNRLRSFWHVWKADYLNQLQRRYKWQRLEPNIKIGQVVLMKEDSPPYQWPLAVVEKLYPDSDGVVRVVDVRVAKSSNVVKSSKKPSNIFKRSIVKLVLLPVESSPEPP